jgi:hypothetical protein
MAGGSVGASQIACTHRRPKRGCLATRVVWSDGTAPVQAREASRPEKSPRLLDPAVAARRGECDFWLGNFLSDELKPTLEVFKAGAAAGFTPHHLRCAKARIGAVSVKQGNGDDAVWGRKRRGVPTAEATHSKMSTEP